MGVIGILLFVTALVVAILAIFETVGEHWLQIVAAFTVHPQQERASGPQRAIA